jgi:predicted transcriptional regulator
MRSTTESKPAADLSHVKVGDVMHRGIISVPPDTHVAVVADVMATHRVHAVAIARPDEVRVPFRIVSALDIVAAAASGTDTTADQIAATEVLSVATQERLDHAAQLMAEHELAHLIVTDSASGQPIGVLSTLDVVAAVGR